MIGIKGAKLLSKHTQCRRPTVEGQKCVFHLQVAVYTGVKETYYKKSEK